MEVLLRGHGGDGGATAGGTAVMEVLLQSLYGATVVMAVPRRPTADWPHPQMF